MSYSLEFRSEKWKRDCLASLGDLSYQQRLLNLNLEEGLRFAMKHYGAWTTEDTLNWNHGQAGLLELKFETLKERYDDTFASVFRHIGLTVRRLEIALAIARNHDTNRMNADTLAQNTHVSSPRTRKWREYFSEALLEEFNQLNGDPLRRLGYPAPYTLPKALRASGS